MRNIPLFVGVLALAQVFCGAASAQQFTAGRLVVERVGTGAPQSSAGTPIFLDEYTTGGAAGVSVPLPVATGGMINQVVESGVVTSGGFITRSQDGKFIVVPGYDATIGTPGIGTTSMNKVITRVDANGGIGSTVLTDATTYSANAFRGVASTDGSGYWMCGAGNGPIYVTHTGNTTPVSGTELSSTIADNRAAFIYNSQFYTSTGVGAATGVYNVGVGLPMTSGNTMTSAVNTGGTGDPYQFVIVNNGNPVMYVADYNNKLIRKYFALGPTWFFAGSTTVTLGGVATGFYGITANVVPGPAVNIYLTTTNIIGSNSRIVMFTDFTSSSTTITGSTPGTTIVGPTTNTAFHGISFVPFNVTSINATSPTVCSGTGTTITISGTPGTSVIYKINAAPQPAVIIGPGGTYTFNTGALTTSTTYTVTSATDGSLTQTYAYGVIVNVNPLPTITVGPPSVICAGTPTTLTATGGATYTWSPGATLSATTGSSVTATPTAITTYTVIGTDINGCVNKGTVTITTNPAPIISTSTPVAICNGQSALLGASGGVTYTWAPATGLSATTGHLVTANPTTTTTYTITGTSGIGCSSSITNTLTVNPLPPVAVSPDVTICTGSSTGLTATGASTYIWLPVTGLSVMVGSSVTANPTTTTTYTVTGTDGNGCKNTAAVTVSVDPLPAVSGGPNVGICIGSSAGLTATGAATYVWSPGASLSSTFGSSVIATPTVTTTYSVIGTDINGCINNSTVTVTVNPLPVVSTGTAVAICIGQSTGLAVSGAATYAWSPATGLSATTGSSVTATPASTTTYTIVGTDVNGCVNSVTNTVTVNMLPVVTASPGVTVCSGTPTTMTASGASTYTWSPGTGLSAIAGSSVTATITTSMTYTVTGTDGNGCQNTATVGISINPLPPVSGGAGVDLCIGSSTGLTATGALTYTWSPATTLSATTGTTVTASPTVTTTYTIVGTDGNGCVNTAFVTATVHPLPYVFPGPNVGICIGSSTGLYVAGTTAYTWMPATGLSATTGSSVTATPTSTTTYTITGTDMHGCVNAATVTVTVYPLPVVSAGPNVAICNGSSTGLTATGGGTYTWAPGYGLSVTTGSSVTAHPATTTTYTVSVINICFNTATVTVSVNPLPVVSAPGATICTGSSTGLVASGAATYTWSPATALSATTGSSVTANPTANTNYTVTGTDINGCVNKSVSTVLVNLLPTITTGPAATICAGSSHVLTASGGSTYTWSPAAGLSTTTGSSVSASPSLTTVYTVTGTSGYGCVNRASVMLAVNPLPMLFAVTGGGTFCAGGIGVPVGLSGSEGGINYALYGNSIFTGVTRVGLGTPLDFGHPGTGGYYTIIATNPATACSDTMTGGVGITINHGPVPVAVTGGGSYCPGGVGVHVGLIGSVTGVLYQLYRDTVAIDTAVAGSGIPIDYGLQTLPGTYTATAVSPGSTCVSNMLGSATVSILSSPAPFAVTGGGTYCEGGPGVHIGLIGSQIGEHYQVYLGTAAVGSSLIGLATPLDFGLFTTPGTYTVTGISSTTGCSDSMSGSATVVITPTPAVYGVALIEHNDTTTLHATIAGGTWSSQYPSVLSVGSGTGVVTGLALGAGEITYTLPTGCSDTHYITVAFNVGVPSVNGASDISLIPNPNNGAFTLSGTLADPSVQEATIEVTDVTGQVVYKNKLAIKNGIIDERIELKDMAAGMYLLSLRTATENKVLRFVKEQ